MKLEEVKLETSPIFNSFGFGVSLMLFLFLFLNQAAPIPNLIALDSITQLPAALSITLATALLFVFHLAGRGVLFLGYVLAQLSTLERFKREWALIRVDHPFAGQMLSELRKKIEFAEGVIGLTAISSFLLLSLNVRHFLGFIPSNFGMGWIEFGTSALLLVLAWVWQRSVFLSMKLAVQAYHFGNFDAAVNKQKDGLQ